MRQIYHLQAKVLESRPLGKAHHWLVLRSPRIATRAKPGQFIHCAPSQPGEPANMLRRPISLSGVSASTASGGLDSLELTFRLVGGGTRLLARRKAGQSVDCLGPLGNGFELKAEKTSLLIAGGIGIAPLRWLAAELANKGSEVWLLAGARSIDDFPYEIAAGGKKTIPEFEELGVKTEFADEREDGLVTELIKRRLPELMKRGRPLQAYAVGPRAMLEALGQVLPQDLPCQVSLEERMACGVGACRACVVEVRRGSPPKRQYVRVCREGPVFDLREIVWESGGRR